MTGVFLLVINERVQCINSINRGVLLCLLIVCGYVFFPSALPAQVIREEMLPPVKTDTEIERRLEVIEERFKKMKLQDVLDEVQRLREEVTVLSGSLGDTDDLSRMDALFNRLDMLEGAVNYYHHRRKTARKIFRELFRRAPDISLSGVIASPKLARYFEALREKYIGYISVETTPEKADVYLGEKLLGQSPLMGAAALAGKYVLRVGAPGYQLWEQPARIRPGKESRYTVTLTKNSSSLRVLTAPSGVSVYLDGKKIGETTGSLAAEAEKYPEDLKQLQDGHVSAQNASIPLILDLIPLGTHILAFRKPCFKELKFKIQIDIGEYFVPPVCLTPDSASVSIVSTPDDRPVYIDEQPVGNTPLKDFSICPGAHRIRIDSGTPSGWFADFEIGSDSHTDITAFPRPTLLFLGCIGTNAADVSASEPIIRDWLEKSGRFNVISGAEASKFRVRPDVAAYLEGILRFKSFDMIPWANLVSTLPVTLSDSNAVLYLTALIGNPDKSESGKLIIFHKDLNSPDILLFPPGKAAETIPDSVQRAFNDVPVISRLWLGVDLVEVSGKVVIAEVDENGPAALSALQIGDILTQVNGQAVHSVNAVNRLLDESVNNPEVTLGYLHAGAEGTCKLTCRTRASMLPLAEPSLNYNLILAQLEETGGSAVDKNAVLLNCGICRLAKGDPRAALDKNFIPCRPGSEPGISNGTLAYLQALAYSRCGETEQAKKMADIAWMSAGATFIDTWGPLIKPLVAAEFR